MSIIKDLVIRDKSYNYLNNENQEICDLSRVNIFIGENNSGKSRFLRSIFYSKEENNLIFKPYNEDFYLFIQDVEELKEAIEENKYHSNSNYSDSYMEIYNKLNSIEYLEESKCPCYELVQLYQHSLPKSENKHSIWGIIISTLDENFEKNIKFEEDLFKYEFEKIYIPSLRGLRPFNLDNTYEKDYYGIRTKNDYFGEISDIETDAQNTLIKTITENNNTIITGLYFYNYVQDYLLGDLDKRKIIEDYQNYLSENFFDNKEVAIIPKLNDEVITVKIGSEKEQLIHNLGDGIQSIILITLPLFLYLKKANENKKILVFIEEPEVGLHPYLQRKLINTFLDDKFKDFQFFFTTHSNHFIDMTLKNEDISIYSFDKIINKDNKTQFNIENVPFNHYPTLNKLGALPSSVLMSNCTILVEGSTDKTHYELYLKLYQDYMYEKDKNFKKFEDGIHYSFLVGGGSEAKNSVKKFSKIEMEKIFFITDQDNKETVNKLKKEYEELNYKNYHILPVKEVENLMNKEIIIKILKNWNNVNNYIQNEDFNEEEYKHANFYKYLKDNLFKDTPKNFPNEYSFKKRFANYEYKNISQYEELTNEIKEVTEKLYDFIIKNNEI